MKVSVYLSKVFFGEKTAEIGAVWLGKLNGVEKKKKKLVTKYFLNGKKCGSWYWAHDMTY